jgi:hypothetical protein
MQTLPYSPPLPPGGAWGWPISPGTPRGDSLLPAGGDCYNNLFKRCRIAPTPPGGAWGWGMPTPPGAPRGDLFRPPLGDCYNLCKCCRIAHPPPGGAWGWGWPPRILLKLSPNADSIVRAWNILALCWVHKLCVLHAVARKLARVSNSMITRA